MVVDLLSRLPSGKVAEAGLDRELTECYADLVRNIFSTEETRNADNSAQFLTADIPAKPTIYELLREQCGATLLREY